MVLTDGQELQVRQLWVTSDFTYWIDQQIKQQARLTYIAVATSQIKEVRFIRRGTGALQGMGFGFLLGAIVGYATREGAPDEDCSAPPPALSSVSIKQVGYCCSGPVVPH